MIMSELHRQDGGKKLKRGLNNCLSLEEVRWGGKRGNWRGPETGLEIFKTRY